MRALAMVLAVIALADAAFAQRPSTLSMSCSQARRLVSSEQAIVMSTGRHTYDRYVSSPGFCPFGEYALVAWVPTRDTRNCQIGFRCDPAPPPWVDDDDGIFGLGRP
jgi:hypothetical protein